ncbi:heme-binding protein 1-like, partial [Notothenia coriiceps]|uniref:Heme-binding protein 1-like n=1 Tax=Notothenia coriiceps TaxID=8208 RepID=A0A6I9NZK6_9TELE
MGEVQFEERLIPPGQWACVSAGEKLFEQSVSVSFMKLMRYICRENSTGRFLGLTVPVVTEVSADGLSMQEVVRTSFFLPSEFQSVPPLPSDPDITIVQREPIRVLSRLVPRLYCCVPPGVWVVFKLSIVFTCDVCFFVWLYSTLV